MRSHTLAAAAIIAAILTLPGSADAQVLKKLKNAAKDAAESEAQMQVDRLIRNAIRCVVDDPVCYEDARASGEEVIFVDDQGEIIVDDQGAPITDRERAMATAPPATRPAGNGTALSYRVTAQSDGSTWGEWLVTQGEEIAVARWLEEGQPGEVALVAGPAVGGLPAEPKDDHGGLLSVLFDPAAGLGPGSWKESGYGSGTAVVDSLRIELTGGEAGETIAGHDTRHHVLTARLWWRHASDEGWETPVFETGTADLWFAPELPFSWLPFAVHPATPGLVFPLVHSWPEVAWTTVARHGARLEDLGLLVRATTRDEIRPDENPDASIQFGGGEYARSVSLSDVAPATEMAEAGPFAEMPRVGRTRMAVLEMALFLFEPCGALESAEAGFFEFHTSGPRSYAGNGAGALVLTDAGVEDSYVVVTGTVRDGRAECTVLMLPGETPREGTFPVVDPNPGFARPATEREGGSDSADTVLGLHVFADGRSIQRILVMDGGQVRIDQAGPSGLSGSLEAEAWGLELAPGYPRRLFEGFGVQVTFQAVPAAVSHEGGSR